MDFRRALFEQKAPVPKKKGHTTSLFDVAGLKIKSDVPKGPSSIQILTSSSLKKDVAATHTHKSNFSAATAALNGTLKSFVVKQKKERITILKKKILLVRGFSNLSFHLLSYIIYYQHHTIGTRGRLSESPSQPDERETRQRISSR